MTELIYQIVSTMMLIIGITLGGTVATKAFGAFKRRVFHFIEIITFVLIIVWIFNTVAFFNLGLIAISVIYFFVGFVTTLFARGMLTCLGVLAVHINEKVLKHYKQEDYVIGLKKALERRGFKEDEIKKVANEIGFKKNLVRDIFAFGYKGKK